MKDTAVQKTASLDEKSVQAIASGEVGPQHVKPRKKPEKRTQPLRRDVKVRKDVWAAARKLLANSYTKIEIVDSETVIVR